MTAIPATGMGATLPAVSVHPVQTPSGQSINVIGDTERVYYETQVRAYQAQHSFTNVSDLQDLDRLVFLELLIYRATSWLGSGQDYYGFELSDKARTDSQRSLKENSALITAVKNDLGLTKSQRDKAQFESVGTYLTDLKIRAREFGVMREEQVGTAIALTKQLFSIVGAFDRSDEVERKKIGFESADEVLDWVRETMKPEFDAVDEYFIAHTQRFWKQV